MRPLDATAGDDGCRPSAGRRCVAGTAAVLGTMGAMARAGLKDALLFGAAALGPLALYVATLPRTVVLEDDGLFLMAGASLGVAHPPGYPLYTLVCHLFMQLPFATPAVSGHLSSAVPGALACAMVAVCARQLGASRCAGLAGAWLLGASEHFWSQAIIAEVYTLNALLFFGVYALLLRVVLRPDTDTGPSAPPASPGTASPEPARRHRRRDRRRRRGRGRDRDRDRGTSSMAASPGPEGLGPDAGGATARAGIVAERNEASAARVGNVARRNGAFAGRVGNVARRNGASAGRAGIVAERNEASAGRVGIAVERNGGSAGRIGIAAAVLYGLGLANHWPLMVLATPGLVIAALPGWRALRPGLLSCAGAALAGAVLPYAWMVWRSRQEPWFSFHGPLESMREVWHYIGRRSYAGVDTSVSADWSDRIQYLLWFGNETLWQLTLPGFVLAAIGLVVLLRRNPPEGGTSPHPHRDPPEGGTGPHPRRNPPEGGTGPHPRRDPPEGGTGPHPRRNPPEGGTGPHPRRRGTRLAAAGGALAWLGNSVVLIGLLSFDFDAFSVSVFRPYSLVCYGLAAVWLAVGLQHLLDTVPKWMGRAAPAHGERARGERAHGPWKGWKPAAALFALVRDRAPRRDARPWKGWKPAAALVAGAGMTALAVHAHGPLNDRSGSDFTSLYARMTLDTLPPDAVLFTSGDTDTAPLGYFRLVEGRRADVELLNTQGLVFGRRLFDWRTREAERDAAIREFVLASERPVFFTSERKPSPGLGVRYHGFLTELVPGGAAIELQLDPRQPRLFEELMRHASRDPWERSRRAQLISTFGKYLGLAVLTGDPGLLERLGPSIAQAEGSFFGLIGMADTLMEHGDPAHHGRIEDLLGRAGPLAGEAEYPEPLARFAYLKGFLRHRLGDPAAARALFEESARIHPHPDNASLGALEQLRSGS